MDLFVARAEPARAADEIAPPAHNQGLVVNGVLIDPFAGDSIVESYDRADSTP